MDFDVKTIWLVAGILSLTFGVLVLVLRRHYEDHLGRALNLWGSACIAIGAAFWMSAVNRRLALSLGSPFIAAVGVTLQYLAVTELKQQKRQMVWVWSVLSVTFCLYIWFGLMQPAPAIGLALINVVRFCILMRIATSLFQKENGERQFVDLIAAAVYSFLSITALAVVVDILRSGHFSAAYNFNSTRTVLNVTTIAVTQTILFTLFLLAITERLNFQFKHQAMHDPLTGLYNRRALEQIGFHQKSLSLRVGQSFSVFIIDVDLFKQINDSYGHNTGDFILKTVGIALKRGLRNEDYLGRWGGDEFCALLPGTSRDQAEIVAQRIMAIFEDLETTVENTPVALGISIGIASIDQSVGGFDALFAMADSALYEAKRQGRRKYVFAEQAEVTQATAASSR